MEERRRNLLVGLFVLCGLLAGGTLIVMFGQGQMPNWLVRGDTYDVHVHFDQITGVREGNLVTVKGIEIGRVAEVGLMTAAAREAVDAGAPVPEAPRVLLVAGEAGVDVRLAIKNRFQIPAGSTAETVEPMLGQGRPPIEIIPGPADAGALAAGASIPGRVRGAIDSIFPSGVVSTFSTTARQIGDAAEALTPVLEEMREMLAKRAPDLVDNAGGPQGNISSAVARLDASLKHFNEVLGDPTVKSQLREIVANARQMSDQGKQVMTDLQGAAGDARSIMADARGFVKNADETLARLDQRVTEVTQAGMGTLDRMDTFLDYLNVVGKQMATGQGNLGRMVMDDKLYEAMVLTAERLAQAVDDFKSLIAEWRQGKVRVAF
jgi:ABC-type transporter Mla subunit MlaD